jgi:Mrp family chromosome partitioning ATPase
MAELESWYQMVVVDTPPVLKVADASFIIGDRVTAVSVARAGVTKTRRYRALHRRLPQEAMVGQVLNQSEVPLRPLDYYYYAQSDLAD